MIMTKSAPLQFTACRHGQDGIARGLVRGSRIRYCEWDIEVRVGDFNGWKLVEHFFWEQKGGVLVKLGTKVAL